MSSPNKDYVVAVVFIWSNTQVLTHTHSCEGSRRESPSSEARGLPSEPEETSVPADWHSENPRSRRKSTLSGKVSELFSNVKLPWMNREWVSRSSFRFFVVPVLAPVHSKWPIDNLPHDRKSDFWTILPGTKIKQSRYRIFSETFKTPVVFYDSLGLWRLG